MSSHEVNKYDILVEILEYLRKSLKRLKWVPIKNRNKILRQFFFNGTNFDSIFEDKIRKAQNVINDGSMIA